ncbi:MAG: transaldolase [Calditrichia bacterium]
MSNLIKLLEAGQSCWLDNLTREKIRSGELKKRVEQEALRGITSNPSIFNKAISEGRDYEDQIRQLARAGKSVTEIYEIVVVQDIQDACDILRPVYEESGGEDGYVSLEVSPYLAHNPRGTVAEAHRLFQWVNRPNCLIKVPGTPRGLAAIRQLLVEGVNVNVTLLFSIESYEMVAQTYIEALETRAREGKSVSDIASVASFFLSRIDVLVDQLLAHRIFPDKDYGDWPDPEKLMGKVGVANAKLAYQRFKKIFSGDRWQALADKGARLQRPLWASTSTKNPRYSDVMYVEPLIGRHTVNTMPDETIAAFADHGVVEEDAIEKNLPETQRVLEDLNKLEIDLDKVTWQLLNEGIQKFIEPYNTLLKTIQKMIERT